MKMSRVVLLLVALVAGGLAAFLATRGGSPQVNPPTEIVKEARAQILVATTPIGMGERLSAKNMQWQDWPTGSVRPEYITSAAMPEATTDMLGTVARFEIFAGEPIRQDKLIRADQGYLSAVLDKGKRGVSIAVQAESASGGFIVPNDHVDVILSHETAMGNTSETILSNVRVLAINTRLGEIGATGAQQNPEDPRAEVFSSNAIATLELDPGQAETVVNAGQLGKLSLSLRSIVDFAPDPNGVVDTQRNAPIRLIRYGNEQSVMAGAPTVAQSGGADIGALSRSPVSVTVAPAAPMVPVTPLAPGATTPVLPSDIPS